MDKLITELLSKPSISPDDAGCQTLIAESLSTWGFRTESLHKNKISNLWAKKTGALNKTFLFAGHTDVVPVGIEKNWRFPPFTPTAHEGFLYARGAADMKVALACMLLAAEEWVKFSQNKAVGSLAFLMTSGEESTTDDGTKFALQELFEKRQEKIDWCLVGEPTSEKKLGDQIKIGRRGSLTGTLVIQGKQGHVAYPHLAMNPIHQAFMALDTLAKHQWDQGNAYFSPTSFQISDIHAGTGASNVIPGELTVLFNCRYSPEITAEKIKHQVQDILKKHALDFSIDWSHSAEPFLTEPGELVLATEKAIESVVQLKPRRSTTGGTSDARFVAAYGIQVVELGFCNETIHQVNERIRIEDILQLKNMYLELMKILLS